MNNYNTVNLFEILNSRNAETIDQGNTAYIKVSKIINDTLNSDEKNPIVLDFKEIDSITSAFINNFFGGIFKNFKFDDLRHIIKISGIKSKDDLEIIKLTIVHSTKSVTN